MARLKKLGKAKIDLEAELWYAEGRNDKYYFNRRLVDIHPDVKAVKSKYKKVVTADTPSMRRPNKRAAHIEILDEYRKVLKECLVKVYDEILAESSNFPIPLRKYRDFDHKSDWRYAIYKGIIYEFDKAGYSDEEMVSQIVQSETPAPKTT